MNLEEGDLQAIIQEGLASDPSTRSYQEAVQLQQQMEQGGSPEPISWADCTGQTSGPSTPRSRERSCCSTPGRSWMNAEA